MEPEQGGASRRWRRFHVALGAIICAVIPALSWCDGSGRLAYPMFAEMQWYQVEIIAVDGDGSMRRVSPTDLANASGTSAAPFFSGADQFRRAPMSWIPRQHVADIARLACMVTGAVRVDVSLLERSTMDAPIRRTEASVGCPR